MRRINLRDFYPFYSADTFVQVPDEVADALLEAKRLEIAYQRRMYRHGAQYSLDRSDGIEFDIRYMSLSPCEMYEQIMTIEQLYAAIASLPDKQGKRIYARYLLGMSNSEIAWAEGVDSRNIRKSISRALKSMAIFLKSSR